MPSLLKWNYLPGIEDNEHRTCSCSCARTRRTLTEGTTRHLPTLTEGTLRGVLDQVARGV